MYAPLLAQHQLVYRRLRALAGERLATGACEQAAVQIQATAEYAWHNHPGCFADEALERMATQLGATLPPGPAPHSFTGEPATVLHVLSRAYRMFGHTRLCWRWIEADRPRRHSIALTNQGGHPVPRELTNASRASSGTLTDLSGLPLLERAARLRALVAGHDAVAVHVHPYDVVAAMAFAHRGPAPVLVLNHADHVFWLGVGSADLVVQIRHAGAELAARRRGVPLERSHVLPIPLARRSPPTGARKRVREELGVRPEDTLLLTVASPYKYEGDARTGFLETVLPALADAPSARLAAAGPSDDGHWADARIATGGRVLPLGMRSDLDSLLEAADVYLDSFPLTSLTAVLEAGLAGLPLLRLAPADEGLGVFEPGDPALDGQLVQAASQPTYRAALRELIENPARRRALGARTGAAVEARHLGPAWLDELAAVYAHAAATAALPRPEAPGQERFEAGALDLALTAINARSDADTAYVRQLAAHCRLLPPPQALRMWLACLAAMREDFRRISPARVRRAVLRARTRRRARSAARAVPS